ncbi:hypothetical protein MMC17_004936 [Xylographa soralifera]|nr:hypothetical protein [Xylographa soralifera]
MSDEQPHFKWKKVNKIIDAFNTRDEGRSRGATEQQLPQRPLSDAPPPRRSDTATTGSVHGSFQATSAYSTPPQGRAWPPQLLGQSSQPYQSYPTPYGPNPPNHFSPPLSVYQYSPPPQQSSTPHQQYSPPLTHYNSYPSHTSATYGQPGAYSPQAGAYSPQTGLPSGSFPSYNSPPPLEHSSSLPDNYGNPYENPTQEPYQSFPQTRSYGPVNGESNRYVSRSSPPQQESSGDRFATDPLTSETCRHGTRITIMSWVYFRYPLLVQIAS